MNKLVNSDKVAINKLISSSTANVHTAPNPY